MPIYVNKKSIQFDSDRTIGLSEHIGGDMHLIGEALPAPSQIVTLGSASVGNSPVAAREDHRHGQSVASNAERDLITAANLNIGDKIITRDNDTEWIWNGTTWKTWNFPVIADFSETTPTLANVTVGNGLSKLRTIVRGGLATCTWEFILGSTSAMGTNPLVTVPYTSAWGGEFQNGSVMLYDATGPRFAGQTYYQGAAQFGLLAYVSSGTYLTQGTVGATTPFTWAVNDFLEATVTYRIA